VHGRRGMVSSLTVDAAGRDVKRAWWDRELSHSRVLLPGERRMSVACAAGLAPFPLVGQSGLYWCRLPSWRPGMRIKTTALMLCILCLPTARSTAPVQVPAGELTPILDRATAYVADYVKSLSSVVAEERFEQRVDTKGDSLTADTTVTRTLVSDYLLVQVPGLNEWLPFRDVYSVDGTPVRDRSDRLLKLFVEAPTQAFTQAIRIREESSRYNIGSGSRDINVPTFALQILTRQLRAGFAFKPRGRERVNDLDTIVVEYEETASSTLIVGRHDENVPARGRLWIDPDTGRVVRTRLETHPDGGNNSIDVVFREEPKLGLWVPSRMDERREAGTRIMEGRATTSRFSRRASARLSRRSGPSTSGRSRSRPRPRPCRIRTSPRTRHHLTAGSTCSFSTICTPSPWRPD